MIDVFWRDSGCTYLWENKKTSFFPKELASVEMFIIDKQNHVEINFSTLPNERSVSQSINGNAKVLFSKHSCSIKK